MQAVTFITADMNTRPLFLGLAAMLMPNALRAQHTNIVLINLDDCGFGDFSYNGAIGYSTPNIDNLACQGMRFTHFLAGQPVSGASRAGLLTGCYPNRVGMAGAPMPNAGYGINPDETLIPEMLKEKGYKSAIFGKWHLGDEKPFLPLQNGFDEFYGLPYSNDMWPFHPSQVFFKFPDLPTYNGNEIIGYNTDQTCLTTDYTTHAVDFIERNQKNPFFLYVAHNMPHVPLAVSSKFKGKSEQGLYGDVMMEIDWSVGQIVNKLKELDLYENTLFILTSDNGPWLNYGNHAGNTAGLREGKSVTFDGGNRVPCLMVWPKTIKPGTTCSRLASNIDLLPTFAAISGASLPEKKIDGVNLMPLLQGEPGANPRTHFAYYFNQNDLEAVTDGKFKLVFPHSWNSYEDNVPGNDGQPGKQTRKSLKDLELYDLRRDPGERYNVISQYPEVVEQLKRYADEVRQDLGDNLTQTAGTGRRPNLKLR